jgi:protein tyrosine/serine phosphatase
MARTPAVALSVVALLVAAVAVGQPHLPAERLDLPGVPNLGRVDARLLRGGQPNAEGFRALAAHGVTLVVDLRNGDERGESERELVTSLGMNYVAIPMSGWRTPQPEQVERFLELLQDDDGGAVFVHCRRGAERTGVMVAAYRMTAQGWSPEEVRVEMDAYRFRAWLHPHLVRWVREFERHPAYSPTPVLVPAHP